MLTCTVHVLETCSTIPDITRQGHATKLELDAGYAHVYHIHSLRNCLHGVCKICNHIDFTCASQLTNGMRGRGLRNRSNFNRKNGFHNEGGCGSHLKWVCLRNQNFANAVELPSTV